jgi:hypothetical protein
VLPRCEGTNPDYGQAVLAVAADAREFSPSPLQELFIATRYLCNRFHTLVGPLPLPLSDLGSHSDTYGSPFRNCATMGSE